MGSVSDRTQPRTIAMEELVAEIRAVVAREAPPDETASEVGGLLARRLDDPDLLAEENRAGSPDGYRQHVLHVEPDGSFSVVALVWLPGQSTPIHDHVAWCVTGVWKGEEHETRYRIVPGGEGEPAHLVEAGSSVNPPGTTCALAPPGDIHRVENGGDERAISIHVYGADIRRLGSSIRRHYELEVHPAP